MTLRSFAEVKNDRNEIPVVDMQSYHTFLSQEK